MCVASPRLVPDSMSPASGSAASMLFASRRTLLASGQINMRKVDGWQTLATKPVDQPIDLAA
jgi:putative transposase